MDMQRVLVVDDEEDFAAFVAQSCRQLGCVVRTCHSSPEAKQAVGDFNPDFMVLDMVMPGEDGIEFLRWFGSTAFRAKVLLVTGFNPKYAEMAGQLGRIAGVEVVGVLTKPVRLKMLQDTLRKHAGSVAA